MADPRALEVVPVVVVLVVVLGGERVELDVTGVVVVGVAGGVLVVGGVLGVVVEPESEG